MLHSLRLQPRSPRFTLQGQRICLEAAGEYTLPSGALVLSDGPQRLDVVLQLDTWDRTMLIEVLSGIGKD